jgi:hypothetical protein
MAAGSVKDGIGAKPPAFTGFTRFLRGAAVFTNP